MLTCRLCSAPLSRVFVDLGSSPLCQSHLREDDLARSEVFYPLRVFICEECYLVQLPEHVSSERIFLEYAYFSSYSGALVEQMREYADMIVPRLALGPGSHVVEIASNDGYLLQFFLPKGIPVLGIEPAANVARAAISKGIQTIVGFFNPILARHLVAEGQSADLLIANNVLPHVPDLHAFVEAMRILLKPRAILTIEFQYLFSMMDQNKWDTIYHEHFSYFSLSSAWRILSAHDLTVFDVEKVSSHGGSLRLYVCHRANSELPITRQVESLLAYEESRGWDRLSTYAHFQQQVEAAKRDILRFFITAKRRGKSVVGYGAPGKANTLLNYCGIRTDLLEYTVDRNPYKQGKFTPGTHIPIYHPDRIAETRPDYVVVFPWNLQREIVAQLAFMQAWGGQFVTLLPKVSVFSPTGAATTEREAALFFA